MGGAAEIAGFSNKETSRQAGKVVDIGTPELVRAMDCGDISIDAAAQIAKQPPEQQKRMVAMPPKERREAAASSFDLSTSGNEAGNDQDPVSPQEGGRYADRGMGPGYAWSAQGCP